MLVFMGTDRRHDAPAAIYLPLLRSTPSREPERETPWPQPGIPPPARRTEPGPDPPRAGAGGRSRGAAHGGASRHPGTSISPTSRSTRTCSARSGRPDVPLRLRAAGREDGRPPRWSSGRDPTLPTSSWSTAAGPPRPAAQQVCVGTRQAIADVAQKSRSGRRVLEAATEDSASRSSATQAGDKGYQALSIDKLTSGRLSRSSSWSTRRVFNAIQRRASDIHIETRDARGDHQVPHRRRALPGDGADRQAPPPDDHLAASRSCPSWTSPRSASRRTAASSCASRGRTIDFRVSIMPVGPRRGLRSSASSTRSRSTRSSRTCALDVLGFDDETSETLRKFIREPYGMVLVTGPDRLGQDDDALRRASSEIQIDRGQDHHHRGPGRVPAAAASRRSRSTRRRA